MFKVTKSDLGKNGGYVQLPSLDLGSNFSVAFWFKLDNFTGTYPRLIDFSSGQPDNQFRVWLYIVNNSIQIRITYGTSGIYFYSLGNLVYGWNHYSIQYSAATNPRLFINGVQRILVGFVPVPYYFTNYLTSNFLGQSNAPESDPKTLGRWRDLVIYKKYLNTNALNDVLNGIISQDSLYYYLPLTNAQYGDSLIKNNYVLPNRSTWSDALNLPSFINSSANNDAATFIYDSTIRVVTGTYKDTLIKNDSLFLNLNNSLTKTSINYALNNNPNYFYANLPSTFKFGKITINNKLTPQRNFNSVWLTPKLAYNKNTWYIIKNLNYTESIFPQTVFVPNNEYTFSTVSPLPAGLSINSSTGEILANTSQIVLQDTSLNISADQNNSLEINRANINVIITNDNSPINYSPNTITINAETYDSSVSATMLNTALQTIYYLDSFKTGLGLRIDSNTGKLYFGNLIILGTYKIKIRGKRPFTGNSVYTYFTLIVNQVPLNLNFAKNYDSFYLNKQPYFLQPIFNTGGDSVKNVRFKLIRQPIGISIDSISGRVTINNLKYARYDSFIIELRNSLFQTVRTTYNFFVVSPPDSVSISYGQVYKTKKASFGNDGGYVQLPSLDLRKNFTIAMWMKFDGTVGGWRRVFDFGTGANYQGVLLGIPSATQLGWFVNIPTTSPTLINFPVGFVPTNWNHYAITFSNNTAQLYLNGVLVSTLTTSGIQQILPSNFLARSNFGNDPLALGSWRDVVIYTKALDTNALSDVMNGIIYDDSLYYYLPLTKAYYGDSNIINNSTIPNNSTWSAALNQSSRINSTADTSSTFIYDSNYRILTGTYNDSLVTNDSFFLRLNNRLTNYPINFTKTGIPNLFYANLPANLKFGKISISNKQLPSRNFNSVWYTSQLNYNKKSWFILSNNMTVDTNFSNVSASISDSIGYNFTFNSALPNSLSLNSINGNLYANSSLSDTNFSFSVSLEPGLNSNNTSTINLIKSTNNNPITYSTDSSIINAGSLDSSLLPLNTSLFPTYFSIDSVKSGLDVSINSTNGRLYFGSYILPGKYTIKIAASRFPNNYKVYSYYYLTVNPINLPIEFDKLTDTFFFIDKGFYTAAPILTNYGGDIVQNIRYYLTNQPQGVSIDSLSGLITIKNPKKVAALDSFTIQVKNSVSEVGYITHYFLFTSPPNQVSIRYGQVLKTKNPVLGSNGSYVQLPNFNLNGDFTIGFWFKLNAFTGS